MVTVIRFHGGVKRERVTYQLDLYGETWTVCWNVKILGNMRIDNTY